MQSLLERVLYLTLALVFVGVIVAFYVLINFSAKLNAELKNQSQELHVLQQVDQNLQQGIAGLKASNDQQTAYLQCLLTALNVGSFPGNCQPLAASPIVTAPTLPATTNNGTQAHGTGTSSHQGSGGGNGGGNPPAGPITDVVQTLTKLIKSF